jgi:hypothetical protein
MCPVTEMSRFLFDRDARIVPDALPEPGQGVEERGLARVRVADESDGEWR